MAAMDDTIAELKSKSAGTQNYGRAAGLLIL